ncbi:uncharacterized protein [Bemisia tabaci]|uniref:uncharacterized protein n=1 Tax=Bemisia tabaci TaxID=7038 RepID=UPI003B28D0B1
MTAGAAPLPTFQKLKGQENWSTWKFQMFNFLNYDDLWDVTDPTQEDSGASKQHMTCYREILTEFQTLPPECITTASNTVIKSQGQGNCLIKLQGSTEPIEVHDVLYVPDLTVNLSSVSRLISKGLSVLFDDEGGTIINSDGDIIATASLFHGVYKLDVQSNEFPQQQTEVSFTSANLARTTKPYGIADLVT